MLRPGSFHNPLYYGVPGAQLSYHSMMNAVCQCLIEHLAYELVDVVANPSAQPGFVDTIDMDILNRVPRIDVDPPPGLLVALLDNKDQLDPVRLGTHSELCCCDETGKLDFNPIQQVVRPLLIQSLANKFLHHAAHSLADVILGNTGDFDAFNDTLGIYWRNGLLAGRRQRGKEEEEQENKFQVLHGGHDKQVPHQCPSP